MRSDRALDPRDLIGQTPFGPLPEIKTILVTGGAGFIGSWVTRHLTIQYTQAYRVVCYDKLDRPASINNIKCLLGYPNFVFVNRDINDVDQLQHVLKAFEVDCILHFAASSHVQDSFTDPFGTVENNVRGTLAVLEAVRRVGRIKRFIHVSTDEVYGETDDTAVDETHTLSPTNPYAASKAAAEMYVKAYQQSFKIPIVIVRSNNVYGPCQYPEKIIPLFTRQLMAGQKMTIQGDGSHSRSYLHASDAASAFDTILHKGEIGETYNIESDFEISNRELAATMLGLFGYGTADDFASYVKWIPDRPFNDSRYLVDGSKLKGLGWRQGIDFFSGLAQTVSWYHKETNWWKI